MQSVFYATAFVGVCIVLFCQHAAASPAPVEPSWASDEPPVMEKAEIAEYVREMLVALTNLSKEHRRILMASTSSLYRVSER